MLKILFEFVGGPNDGVSLQGALGDASDAERYFLFTNRGAIGQRFKTASELAVDTLSQLQSDKEVRHQFQQHYYVVTDRVEEHDEVLVRAEYVEPKSDKAADTLVRRHLEPASSAAQSHAAMVHQFLLQTARSMAESYSHCWPADDPESQSVLQDHIRLHLGHVLLSEEFSVFAHAYRASVSQQKIDLLGIAPSQDWFLAFEFGQFGEVPSLQELMPCLHGLTSFWLDSRLTISACSEHIDRLAKHCQEGFGVVLCGHWIADGDSGRTLLDCWLRNRLSELEAEWHDPVAVCHFDRTGTYYLFAVSFRIPHGDARD